jgi:hypothetical protein
MNACSSFDHDLVTKTSQFIYDIWHERYALLAISNFSRNSNSHGLNRTGCADLRLRETAKFAFIYREKW